MSQPSYRCSTSQYSFLCPFLLWVHPPLHAATLCAGINHNRHYMRIWIACNGISKLLAWSRSNVQSCYWSSFIRGSVICTAINQYGTTGCTTYLFKIKLKRYASFATPAACPNHWVICCVCQGVQCGSHWETRATWAGECGRMAAKPNKCDCAW